MNIRNYTIIILILIMSTTIISCNSLRSNEDNEKQELQSVEDNKQLLNEISNIRNEVQTLKKSIDSNNNELNENENMKNQIQQEIEDAKKLLSELKD